MEFEAISTTRMISLMVAGALFAGAGLFMMLRPKPEGTAKIELFGLKFESSSAGLLVFVIGAAFLSLPLFVPERGAFAPEPPIAIQPPMEGGLQSKSEGTPPTVPDGFQKVDLTKPIEEAEPNDTIDAAQLLLPGQRVSGEIGYQATDWFVIPYAEVLGGQEIKVRRLSGSGVVVAAAFDAREQVIGQVRVGDGTQYLSVDAPPGDTMYLRVTEDIGLDARYELVMTSVTSN